MTPNTLSDIFREGKRPTSTHHDPLTELARDSGVCNIRPRECTELNTPTDQRRIASKLKPLALVIKSSHKQNNSLYMWTVHNFPTVIFLIKVSFITDELIINTLPP